MNIETRFDNGDKVWVMAGKYGVNCFTVGLVRVEITDSPGLDGETTFDNYMPQKGRKEEYMCIETGIGSGTVYTLGKNIFTTENEALSALSEWQETYGK